MIASSRLSPVKVSQRVLCGRKLLGPCFRYISVRGFSAKPIPDLYTPDSSRVSSKDLVNNLDTLSNSSMRFEPEVINRYFNRVKELMNDNKLSPRECFQIVHSLARFDGSVFPPAKPDSRPPLDEFMADLNRKLRRSTRFISSVTPIDITIGLTALTKLRDKANSHLVSSIAKSLYDEIPSRLSLFDDHHFGQILNSMWRLDTTDHIIAREIINELNTKRDVARFNPQSIVVLASSLSRISPQDSADNLSTIWTSILKGALRIEPTQMQPNWPLVLLDSFSFSHVCGQSSGAVFCQDEFVNKMIRMIVKSNSSDERSIVRTVQTLKRIGYSESSALSKVSSAIRKTSPS